MKNSKLRRILLTLACAVLLVSLSVGATLAYLTNVTQVVTNTFTVGNVKITLDEGKVWEKNDDGFTAENNGKFIDEGKTRTTTGNEYKLIPGRTYDKDPTVYVDPASEDAYIFVQVVNGFKDYEAVNGNTILEQMEALNWVKVAENVYCKTVDGTNAKVCDSTEPIVVFNRFTVSGTLTDEQYAAAEEAEVTIIAYAIQAEGIDASDPVAIWGLYSNQQ